MTRKEALKELNELREYCEDTFLKRTQIPYLNALDMAIKALEQEPCEEELDFVQEHKKISCNLIVEPCEDCISRQAVLNIVDSYSESQSNVEDVTQDIISDIVALPPITPQPKTGQWIHTDECDEEWQYRCSKCNMPSRSNAHRYCSNCGSYMYGIEPQESEEI